MKTISFQTTEEANKLLEQYAKKLDRSKGYLLRKAMNEMLEDLKDYVEVKNYKKSYDSSENISLSDLKKKYKLN